MTIVMFHSGHSLPTFLEDNFKQLRLFNPVISVYFLTDKKFLSDELFIKYNINPVDKDKYASEDINIFSVLYGRGQYDFWTITTTRLMYIANFIEENNLHNVYHFENDVLLYFNLEDSNSLFVKTYSNLAVTVAGPDKAMTGFMFIKNPKALKRLTEFFISLLKKYKIRDIRKLYGMDMVHEMSLMRVYNKEHPDKLQALPILPFGEWSEGFDVFNSIFDPASWGQYVGGTGDGIPGAKPEDHYIGQLLRNNLSYTVVWHMMEKGSVPYFKYEGNEVKINNLHIHSKQLNKYLSNE